MRFAHFEDGIGRMVLKNYEEYKFIKKYYVGNMQMKLFHDLVRLSLCKTNVTGHFLLTFCLSWFLKFEFR